jgi:hypothetical protein
LTAITPQPVITNSFYSFQLVDNPQQKTERTIL